VPEEKMEGPNSPWDLTLWSLTKLIDVVPHR